MGTCDDLYLWHIKIETSGSFVFMPTDTTSPMHNKQIKKWGAMRKKGRKTTRKRERETNSICPDLNLFCHRLQRCLSQLQKVILLESSTVSENVYVCIMGRVVKQSDNMEFSVHLLDNSNQETA